MQIKVCNEIANLKKRICAMKYYISAKRQCFSLKLYTVP